MISKKWKVAALGLTFLLFLTDLPLQAEIACIEAYRKVGSPVTSLVATCRFQPTCSAYALHSLREDGFWKGNAKIAIRLIHCSPLGAFYDWLSGKEVWKSSRGGLPASRTMPERKRT